MGPEKTSIEMWFLAQPLSGRETLAKSNWNYDMGPSVVD